MLLRNLSFPIHEQADESRQRNAHSAPATFGISINRPTQWLVYTKSHAKDSYPRSVFWAPYPLVAGAKRGLFFAFRPRFG